MPIEKIYEKPIYIEKIREVPHERIVEKPVERIIENQIFRDEVLEIDEKDIGMYQNQAYKILPTQVDVYQQDVVKQVRKS